MVDPSPSRIGPRPIRQHCCAHLTVGRERLPRAEAITLAAIESSVTLLVDGREIVLFWSSRASFDERPLPDLDGWVSLCPVPPKCCRSC